MALQGTLDTFALVDVLHLLGSTRKTGRLRLEGARGIGQVWLEGGHVVQARATGARPADGPADVFFELLRFEQGAFSFEPDVPADDPVPATDVDALVAEAQILLEEWRVIAEVVPHLDLWVTLVPELAGDSVTVLASHWLALTKIGLGCSLRTLGESLDASEIAVSRLAKELVETGLVQLAEDRAPGALRNASPSSWESDLGGAHRTVSTAAVVDGQVSLASHLSTFAPDGGGTPAYAPAPAYEPADPAPADTASSWGAPAQSAPAPAVPHADYGDLGIQIPGFSSLRPIVPVAEAAPAAPEVVPITLSSALSAASAADLADERIDDEPADEDDDPGVDFGRLTPQAARAIAMAAQATTEAERDAMLAQATDANDEPLDRGLLLRFLSSVKQ